MKNKIFLSFNLFFLAALLISMFLPIDSIYIYVIELGICIFVFLYLFIELLLKKKKIFFLLLVLQLLPFVFFIISAHVYRYSIYKIGWKINQWFMLLPISISTLIFANQIFQKKRVLKISFVFLQLFILTKSLLFTQFYEFNINKDVADNIKDFPEYKNQYKVTGAYTLKNKTPAEFTEKDFSDIKFLLNETDWLKENYPENYFEVSQTIDDNFLRKNLQYEFSVIQFYNLKKADVYKLSLPLHNKNEKIQLYIPKGEFSLYSEVIIEYEKYYKNLPEKTEYSLYMYEGLYLPITQEWYETCIDMW